MDNEHTSQRYTWSYFFADQEVMVVVSQCLVQVVCGIPDRVRLFDVGQTTAQLCTLIGRLNRRIQQRESLV